MAPDWLRGAAASGDSPSMDLSFGPLDQVGFTPGGGTGQGAQWERDPVHLGGGPLGTGLGSSSPLPQPCAAQSAPGHPETAITTMAGGGTLARVMSPSRFDLSPIMGLLLGISAPARNAGQTQLSHSPAAVAAATATRTAYKQSGS